MLQQRSPITLRETVGNYVRLMKPGILVLLVFEAITSMIVAAGIHVNVYSLGWLALAGALGSGGSSALNHYLERDQDKLMTRTDGRPVATNLIPPRNAVAFGFVSIGLSLLISSVFINLMTALMIFLGTISYAVVYTLILKPRTHWNIVIGGIAGVFPALAGWAAATGSVQWPAIFIGSLVFLWTPPHFWGLAIKFKDDYKRAGFPLLPVIKDQKEVIRWIVLSSIPLLPFSLLPLIFPELGTYDLIYYSTALFMGLSFLFVDYRMIRNPTVDNGFKAFLVSLPYLFFIFGAMIASSVL